MKPVNKAFIEDFIVHGTMKEIRDGKLTLHINYREDEDRHL